MEKIQASRTFTECLLHGTTNCWVSIVCCPSQRLLVASTISVLLLFTVSTPVLLMMPKCSTEASALLESLTVRGDHENGSRLWHTKRGLREISGWVSAFLMKVSPFPSYFLLSSSWNGREAGDRTATLCSWLNKRKRENHVLRKAEQKVPGTWDTGTILQSLHLPSAASLRTHPGKETPLG